MIFLQNLTQEILGSLFLGLFKDFALVFRLQQQHRQP